MFAFGPFDDAREFLEWDTLQAKVSSSWYGVPESPRFPELSQIVSTDGPRFVLEGSPRAQKHGVVREPL